MYAASSKHLLPAYICDEISQDPLHVFKYGITDLRSLIASWKKWHERMAERAAVKKVVEQKEKMKAARKDYIL